MLIWFVVSSSLKKSLSRLFWYYGQWFSFWRFWTISEQYLYFHADHETSQMQTSYTPFFCLWWPSKPHLQLAGNYSIWSKNVHFCHLRIIKALCEYCWYQTSEIRGLSNSAAQSSRVNDHEMLCSTEKTCNRNCIIKHFFLVVEHYQSCKIYRVRS